MFGILSDTVCNNCVCVCVAEMKKYNLLFQLRIVGMYLLSLLTFYIYGDRGTIKMKDII